MLADSECYSGGDVDELSGRGIAYETKPAGCTTGSTAGPSTRTRAVQRVLAQDDKSKKCKTKPAAFAAGLFYPQST